MAPVEHVPENAGLVPSAAQALDAPDWPAGAEVVDCPAADAPSPFQALYSERGATMEKVGKYAFIVGLVLAVLAGLGLEQTWVAWILALLGLIVGFLNVGEKETQGFLLAAIGLMLSATAIHAIPFVGGMLTRIVAYLVVFIAPAVLIVALKSLLVTAKD